ncbi:hypothetical protein V5O48_010680 [Marasmius crinis-equi]|uniref:Lupus La protein n=1 Tax=Marasmius crinis-equi TaxID=585013 RepID=A0ABR3F7Q7_9AGAR
MSEVTAEKPVQNGSSSTEETTAKAEKTDISGDVEMSNDEEKNLQARALRQGKYISALPFSLLRMGLYFTVEFYFADSNLPYDKFMWSLHSRDPEHWVSIDTIAAFKRMRQFSKHGVAWVTDALRTSEFFEVDESGRKVRRKTEVKEPTGQFARSVYAKGFPDEDDKLQERLEDFFQGYASTNEVRMRRDEDKKFKNSVFVEFTEPSGVQAFLNADPKPTFDGKELLVMTKEDYCEMKIKEKGLKGKAADRKRDTFNNRRGFSAFTVPKKEGGLAADDAAPADGKPKREVYMEYFGKKLLISKDNHGNGTVKEEDIPFVKGSTLKFEGVGENFSWNDIKNPIRELFDNKAPYIEYNRGDNHGLVGFHATLSEEDIEKVKNAVKTINDKEITWSQIPEEEEKAFMIKRAQSGARHALRQAEESGDSGRGGRGGRGGGRGGRGARGGGRGGRGRGGRGGGGRGGRDSDRNGADREAADNAQVGEKRKRAIEPDGGPDVGVRGQDAPPTLQAAKKAKTDGESS